jgi:IMP cyclohydrolase
VEYHKERVEEILYFQLSHLPEVEVVVHQVLLEMLEALVVAVVKMQMEELEILQVYHHHKETMAETQHQVMVEELEEEALVVLEQTHPVEALMVDQEQQIQ